MWGWTGPVCRGKKNIRWVLLDDVSLPISFRSGGANSETRFLFCTEIPGRGCHMSGITAESTGCPTLQWFYPADSRRCRRQGQGHPIGVGIKVFGLSTILQSGTNWVAGFIVAAAAGSRSTKQERHPATTGPGRPPSVSSSIEACFKGRHLPQPSQQGFFPIRPFDILGSGAFSFPKKTRLRGCYWFVGQIRSRQ